MRAMTEIPAKIPRPMGSTERCVPGSTNAGALDCAVSAADVALVEEPFDKSPAAVPVPLGAGVAVAGGFASVSVATADASIVEKPYKKYQPHEVTGSIPYENSQRQRQHLQRKRWRWQMLRSPLRTRYLWHPWKGRNLGFGIRPVYEQE